MTKTIVFLLLLCNICFGQQKKMSACVLSKDIYRYFKDMSDDSLKHILAADHSECSLPLADSVVGNFIINGDEKVFRMLEQVWDCSDGQLSGYLVEGMGKIYRKKFLVFFEYLHADHQNRKKKQARRPAD